MTDYKPGDVVTLEHEDGSRLVREINPMGRLSLVRGFEASIGELEVNNGWRVTDHKPKIELPTEDGYYLDCESEMWQIANGEWFYEGSSQDRGAETEYAPFTRLVPEGSEREAAIREVIEWYEAMLWADGFLVTHANARDKFGILK